MDPAALKGLRQELFDKVKAYAELAHRPSPFVPGKSKVHYAGRVFDHEELMNLVDASLEFWLTLGRYGRKFERRFAETVGVNEIILVNSGSSANLVAITSLLSPQVPDYLQQGDEVITPAVTFPSTLAPIVQNGLVPVFVDCELGTYDIDPSALEEAVSPRTRAMVVPHTLGNPCDLAAIMDVCQRHRLFLVEDCCDALGATYDGRPVGTFGDFGTLSCYPAHHITMGEGGVVFTKNASLARVARSIRDWGRDCWCDPGVANTCGKRFEWQLGTLPPGYDHKYIYSHIGYNLKPTDLQAAIGVAQLEKLPGFVERRRRNFAMLYEGLRRFEEALILPRWSPRAEPSWFAFPLTVRPESGLQLSKLIDWLEAGNVETRPIFAGNILRHPGYVDIPRRQVGDLSNSDLVLSHSFFVGVYPGLSDAHIEYVIERFCDFFSA